MSDLRVKTGTSSVTHGNADQVWTNLRSTRDGAFIGCNWLTAHALEGRAFIVNAGTGTGPSTGSPTIDVAMPDLLVGVPTGTTIMPVLIEISLEDTGTVAIVDVLACASSVYDIAVTATATLVIYNMRLNSTNKSTCYAGGPVTANGTSPYTAGYNWVDFFRGASGMVEDAFNGTVAPTNQLISRTSWGANEALYTPVIVGPGSLNIYTATQAPKAFITAAWIEVPSTSIT